MQLQEVQFNVNSRQKDNHQESSERVAMCGYLKFRFNKCAPSYLASLEFT